MKSQEKAGGVDARMSIRPTKASIMRDNRLKETWSNRNEKKITAKELPKKNPSDLRSHPSSSNSSSSSASRRDLLEKWRQEKGKTKTSIQQVSAPSKRPVLSAIQPAIKQTRRNSPTVKTTVAPSRNHQRVVTDEKTGGKTFTKVPPTTKSVVKLTGGVTPGKISHQSMRLSTAGQKLSEVPSWKRRQEYAEKMRRLTIAGSISSSISNRASAPDSRRATITKVSAINKHKHTSIIDRKTPKSTKPKDNSAATNGLADVGNRQRQNGGPNRNVPHRAPTGTKAVKPPQNDTHRPKYKVVVSKTNSNLSKTTKTKSLTTIKKPATPKRTPPNDLPKQNKRKSILRSDVARPKSEMVMATPRSTVRFAAVSRLTPSLCPHTPHSPFSRGQELSRNTPVLKENDRREKLAEWLRARGKTPSLYPHLVCMCSDESKALPTHLVASGLSEDQLAQQQAAIGDEVAESGEPSNHGNSTASKILREIETLAEQGYNKEDIDVWLGEIERLVGREDLVQLAAYWMCVARVAEVRGDAESQADVLSAYEQAARHQAQPASDLAVGITGYVQRLNTTQNIVPPPHTPRTPRHINPDNIINSSAIKLSYSKNTPLFSRIQNETGPRAIITPVRRSTRLSSNVRRSCPEHHVLYDEMDEINEDNRAAALFVPNHTLTYDD